MASVAAADLPVGAKVEHNNITFTKTDHVTPWRTHRFGRFTNEQMDEFLTLDREEANHV